MADVISGPVATLPGSFHKLPANATCDTHPQRWAVCRIQGATDAHGCELIDACVECRGMVLNQVQLLDDQRCELCGQVKDSLTRWRNYQEGSAAHVQRVCPECISQVNSGGEESAVVEAQDVAQMVEEFDPSIDPDDPDAVELPDEYISTDDADEQEQ